ncbi:MAG TPA: hypothetical protein QGF58_18935 [Myxococcota bacterium]|jgi:hypothetical protein|nr:hypothetical protein [Myxococcota bacterium]
MRICLATTALLGLAACPVPPLDSGDSGASGCCYYACDDGETSGWVVAASDNECRVLAEDNCAGGGLQVSDQLYDDSCGSRCDDCDPGF